MEKTKVKIKKNKTLRLKKPGKKFAKRRSRKSVDSKNILQPKETNQHSPVLKINNNPNLNKIKQNYDYKPETDYEYNWLIYEDAIKFDKRTNCDYYSSLLRSKQLFIFTFCSFNDYNSGVV